MTPSIQKALKSFDENHKKYFAVLSLDCKKCSHTKDTHYWNGGGNQDNSGYDSCRACGCVDYEMDDFREKTIGYEEKYNDIKSFLTTALEEIAQAEYARGLEEAGCYNTCLDCEKPLWKHKCNQMKK